MLTVELHKLQTATLKRTTTPRNKPLTQGAKAFLINIAYSPVRGVKNLRRLFKVGVMTIHKSALATAMILHALQLGCSFIFHWKLLWRVHDFTLSEVGGSESTSGHAPKTIKSCVVLSERAARCGNVNTKRTETKWVQVRRGEAKSVQVRPNENKLTQVNPSVIKWDTIFPKASYPAFVGLSDFDFLARQIPWDLVLVLQNCCRDLFYRSLKDVNVFHNVFSRL